MKQFIITFILILITTTASAVEGPYYITENEVKYASCQIQGLYIDFVTMDKEGTTFKMECEENQFFLLYEFEDDFYFVHYFITYDGEEHSWYGFVLKPIMQNLTRVRYMKGSSTNQVFELGEVTKALTCPSKNEFCKSKKYKWLLKHKGFID